MRPRYPTVGQEEMAVPTQTLPTRQTTERRVQRFTRNLTMQRPIQPPQPSRSPSPHRRTAYPRAAVYTAKLSHPPTVAQSQTLKYQLRKKPATSPLLYVCGSADCGKVGVGECKQLPTQTMVGSSPCQLPTRYCYT